MSSQRARSLPEATLYLLLQDYEPVDYEVTMRQGTAHHRIVCLQGTEEQIEVFEFQVPPPVDGGGLLGGPEPSTLITPDQFLRTAERLAGNVPLRPLALVPAAVRGVLSDLQLALASVQEAFRFIPDGTNALPSPPGGGSGPTRSQLFELAKGLRARFERWQAIQPLLAPAPELSDLPSPKLSLTQLRAAKGASGMHALDVLRGALGPWAFAGRIAGPPERALFRHVDGLAMWATLQGDRIESVQLLEGTPALEVHAAHSFRLTARQRLRLRRALRPGLRAARALSDALDAPDRIELLMGAQAEGQVVRFHRIDTMGVHRSACLITIEDASGALLGHRLLEATTALQQLEVLAEAAPRLPGPSGEPPEIRARQLVLGQVAVIAAAARNVILALRDPSFDTRTLQPRPEDYAKVFLGPLADHAQRHFEPLWRARTPMLAHDTKTHPLSVAVCPAGAFRAIPELSAGFPDGYTTLATSLMPGFTWVAWRVGAGSREDSLVWIEDHWSWFPKLGASALEGRWT